jgi:hypothetical protein
MRTIFKKPHAFISTGLIVFALSAVHAGQAYAANPFSIEHNANGSVGGAIVTDINNSGVPQTNPPTCDSPSPQACRQNDIFGSSKELGPLNSNTTKIGVIHTSPLPTLGATNPNGQVDLTVGWTQSRITSDDHIWLYFAWSRVKNTGSGFLSIEIEKAPVGDSLGRTSDGCKYDSSTDDQLIARCNPWAGRQAGDFIILWDQQGNSRDLFIRFFTDPTCANPNGCGFGRPLVLGPAQKLVNADAEYCSSFFCGEAAVDLTAAGVFGSTQQCVSLANTIPGTVTGNSDTADYKDAIMAPFPPISNCGIVTVTKVTDPNGQSGNFPYSVSRTGGSSIFSNDIDTDCNSSGSQTQCDATLLFDRDTDTISNLLAGNDYRVVEGTPTPDFGEVSLDCVLDGVTYHLFVGGTVVNSFPVAANKITACTITNRKLSGLIRIVKVVNNSFGLTAVPGDFNFTLDGGQEQPFANSGTSCVSAQTCKELSFLVGSVHNVNEPNPPTNWSVSYNGCSNMTVSATEVRVCTVTNTATQATPAAVTRQRVLLFDRATITGLRRLTSNEPAMTVTFSVYPDLTSCNAQSSALGSEAVQIPANQSATEVSVGTSNNTVEVKLDSAGDATTARYWRAVFNQAGTNPPNGSYTTPCTEITTIRLQQ